MSLSAGTRLGPYEILSALGAGGMGEVYRARDTRLDRTVAIKLLPPELAGDADLRARFEREARAIAALEHSHICPIYDVGQHEGVHYLVMQHLEGETLAARLARTNGPLPLEHALQIAIEIAAALDRTHRAGITHRDLKPANIMLTKSGAKLLDFGLAKLRGSVAPISMSGMTRGVTTTPNTAHGTILGTLQYMAPEQVEGRDADARSDLWALGAVIYEMATGTRPFEGESPASVIGAILKDSPPPLSTRQPLAPAALAHVVERCLAKERDERWQSASDVKYQLAWIAQTPNAPAPGSVTAHRRRPALTWMGVAGAALLCSAVTGFLIWSLAMRSTGLPAQPLVRLALDLGPDVPPLSATGTDTTIISPDGTRIVYVSTGPDGIRRLSARRLDQSESIPLPGTGGAYAPFFSPDGQWVGFFAGGKLKKTRLDGSEAIALCDAPAGRGASWGEDGRIVAALDVRGGLSLVTSDAGIVTPVTETEVGELTHRRPQILPGGQAVLFTVNSVPANYESASIAVASLVNNPEKVKRIVLANAGVAPRYLPTGHLVYLTKGTLYAVPFDLARLEVRGTPAPVLEDVSADMAFGTAHLDISGSGTMVYRPGRTTGLRVIQWLNRDGKTESVWEDSAYYQMPRVSPDGSRLAYVLTEGSNSHIWVYDLQRGTRSRLTSGPGVNSYPIWSSDGQHVVFSSGGGVFSARGDGAERPRRLMKGQRLQFASSFTADGKLLAFYEHAPGGKGLIQTVAVDNSSGQLRVGEPTLFRETPSSYPAPAFSPDGKWLAYASAESGIYEVYVRAFPDKGNQRQISTVGGNLPMWSRSGNELFYRTEDQRLMVTTYTVTADSFVSRRPRVWSEMQIFNSGLTPNFDLAPDGQRFVVEMSAESPQPRETSRQVTLLLNFFDEVRRRVAVAGQ